MLKVLVTSAIYCFATLSPTMLHAAAAKKGSSEKVKAEDDKKASAEKTDEAPSESESGRKGHGVDALLGFTAFGGQGGVDYWHKVAKNGFAGLLVLGGNGSITANSDTALLLEYMTASYTELDVAYRHYFGNSFYLQGILAYANYAGKYGFKGNDKVNVSGEVTVPYKTNIASLGIGIGNLWSWNSGFNLGCTWAGYNAPISANTTVSDVETAGNSNQQVVALVIGEDVKSKVNSNVKSMNSLYLLRLQIGYQF